MALRTVAPHEYIAVIRRSVDVTINAGISKHPLSILFRL